MARSLANNGSNTLAEQVILWSRRVAIVFTLLLQVIESLSTGWIIDVTMRQTPAVAVKALSRTSIKPARYIQGNRLVRKPAQPPACCVAAGNDNAEHIPVRNAKQTPHQMWRRSRKISNLFQWFPCDVPGSS